MAGIKVKDSRYQFKRDEASDSLDAFYEMAVATKIPLQVIDLKPGELISIPVCVDGTKTKVNYAGRAPYVSANLDKFKNLQVRVFQGCAMEVIFTSEKIGAAGRNKGPHPKKIVYTVK